MCLNYTRFIFSFLICACTCSTCSFVFASAAVAQGIIVLLKKSRSYFMNIMYKSIFLNFGVIPLINKEMVSLFQLHMHKFDLVYINFCRRWARSRYRFASQAASVSTEIKYRIVSAQLKIKITTSAFCDNIR